MSHDGRRASALPRIEITGAGAGPDETAAIAAAIELFLAEAATSPTPGAGGVERAWVRAALLEGVGLEADRARSLPWR